jgi:hypothetical protein
MLAFDDGEIDAAGQNQASTFARGYHHHPLAALGKRQDRGVR